MHAFRRKLSVKELEESVSYHKFLLRGMGPLSLKPPQSVTPIMDVTKLQIVNLEILFLWPL